MFIVVIHSVSVYMFESCFDAFFYIFLLFFFMFSAIFEATSISFYCESGVHVGRDSNDNMLSMTRFRWAKVDLSKWRLKVEERHA